MAERSETDLEPFLQTACKAIRYAAATAYAFGWQNGYNDAKDAHQPALDLEAEIRKLLNASYNSAS